MANFPPPWTLGQLASLLDAKLQGPADFVVDRPAAADEDDPRGIAFAESEKYLRTAEESHIGALLLPPSLDTTKPHLTVAHPRRAFGALLAWALKPLPLQPGIHPTAVVADSAQIDASASIGPYAVVECGVVIGARCRVYAHAYIGEGCILEEQCVIYPHAVLYRDVVLGARTVIHAGAILGSDGFGYFWDGKGQQKVPQTGRVMLGADCEIGSLTAIDRATAGTTRVDDGVKIDNLVQIAHNVRIGEHTVIASLCGVSGSARIGKRVTMAGKADLVDHVSICDDVMLGGRTAVARDINVPGAYLGAPAMPARDGLKALALQSRIPDLFERMRALETRIKELEAKD
jgi:UDP-3-O-[3-hydroxymyristoyl] glucosamine N-acyltransferase